MFVEKKVLVIVIVIIGNILNLVFIGIIKLVVLKDFDFIILASRVARAIAIIASAIIANFYELI